MTKQHRNWYRLLALLLSFGLVAAACGSDDSSDESEETESSQEAEAESTDEAESDEEAESADATSGAIRVAIVAPSAENDLAFSQSMFDSLEALDREIELESTDSTGNPEDAAAAMRGYAEDGVDVIIAHGTQYGGSLGEIAGEFPEVTFIWGTATDTKGLANVFAYSPAADQGGYVNGILAAELSESGKIGVVGPIEAGDAVTYIAGFQAGAEHGGAEVSVVYTGDFGDVALAAATAEAHIANDADVLSGTAQMVVGAVGIAADAGVPWFGTQSNQASLSSEVVVASQVYHWEVVLEQMFALRDEGTIGGEAFVIDLANGGLVIEFNEDFGLSDELKTLANDTIAGIIDGSISTGA